MLIFYCLCPFFHLLSPLFVCLACCFTCLCQLFAYFSLLCLFTPMTRPIFPSYCPALPLFHVKQCVFNAISSRFAWNFAVSSQFSQCFMWNIEFFSVCGADMGWGRVFPPFAWNVRFFSAGYFTNYGCFTWNIHFPAGMSPVVAAFVRKTRFLPF